MDTFVCAKCGYVAFKNAPDKCPVCGAPKAAFKLDPAIVKNPVDLKNLNELEKKHIPVIEVNKQCALIGLGCMDVNIKVGQVLHVMEASHYIMYIDLYLDYEFIGRYHLSPQKLNPVLGIHLKVLSGRLLALENCNLHGCWVSEVNL